MNTDRQKAYEQDAFNKWFATAGIWNRAISRETWQAACAWMRETNAAACDSVVTESRNSLFRSGAKICAGLIREDAPGLPCDAPPAGWTCSREKGHEGPCAATPVESTSPITGFSEPDGGAGDVRGEPVEMYALRKNREACLRLADWLRGEAGRHMATVRASKGAPPDQHALQLRLWADNVRVLTAPSQPAAPADDRQDAACSVQDKCEWPACRRECVIRTAAPSTAAQAVPITKEWCMNMAKLEPEDGDISAGAPSTAAQGATFVGPVSIHRTHPNQAYVTLGFGSEEECTQFIKATRSGSRAPTPVADSEKVREIWEKVAKRHKDGFGSGMFDALLVDFAGELLAAAKPISVPSVPRIATQDMFDAAEPLTRGEELDLQAIWQAMYDAAKPVSVDAGGMTEVVAELVKCRDMKGSEWFDVKVFDKTLPNGTKLCVATPPTESTGEPNAEAN